MRSSHRLMSKFFTPVLLSLTIASALAGCGGAQSDPIQAAGTTSVATVSGELVGTLTLPYGYGATTTINYNGKAYIIGSQSAVAATQAIQQIQVQSYANTSINVRFSGTFTQESGRFPNPTATFDVVNLQTLSRY